MKTFNDYCNYHKCDKGDGYDFSNDYANFYESWFSKIRNKNVAICEIGILDGASLKCYYDYFPNAEILGLDIDTGKMNHQNDRIRTAILDQSSVHQLEHFAESNIGNFDIVLDDGSHDVEHQQVTFGKLFKTVKSGGIYIIEDLGSSFFTLEMAHYNYKQTLKKINNNTVKFLTDRPFSSVWIGDSDLEYINEHIEYVSLFDKVNHSLPYKNSISCMHKYPIRSITSVIKKK